MKMSIKDQLTKRRKFKTLYNFKLNQSVNGKCILPFFIYKSMQLLCKYSSDVVIDKFEYN